MALPSAVARMLGAKYGRRLVGDYDPNNPLGDTPAAPQYDVAVGPISINSRTPADGGGDQLATPEEMRPPAPLVPGGFKASDGPDTEPDGDPDDSAHLAMLATASRPAVRSAPTPDESWGTYGEAKGLSQARASDRESMLANMFQRSGRQLIGGLTRTAEADTIAAPVDAEKRYLSAQAMRREAALKALKDAREGRVADADVELKLAEADKARRLPMVPAPKPPKDDSLGQDRLALEREKWEWAKAHPKAPKPPPPGQTPESLSVPFDSGSFEPRAGTSLDKESVRKARGDASLYSAAIAGMDDYAKALEDFAAHPSVAGRSALRAKVGVVAGALNTAAGQGAMSKDEYAQRVADLGVPGATPDTLAALMDKATGDDPAAAKAILGRVRSVRAATKAATIGRLKPYNYEFRDSSPQASATVKTLKDGTTWRQLGPGKWERVQ